MEDSEDEAENGQDDGEHIATDPASGDNTDVEEQGYKGSRGATRGTRGKRGRGAGRAAGTRRKKAAEGIDGDPAVDGAKLARDAKIADDNALFSTFWHFRMLREIMAVE